MAVGDSRGQRIRSIGLRLFFKAKQHPHHVLNLLFGRLAASDRGLFHLQRAVLGHFHAAPSCCQQVPVDAGNEHFEWYVAPENGHLIIIRDGDAERLDPWVRNRIRPVEIADDVGPYTIWLGKSPTDSPTDLPQR